MVLAIGSFLIAVLLGYILINVLKEENDITENNENLGRREINVCTLRTKNQGAHPEYLLTDTGNLLSVNKDTWEIDYKHKKDILICSNNCADKKGSIYNSIRDIYGKKVTIYRHNMLYDSLRAFKLDVINSDDRHLINLTARGL